MKPISSSYKTFIFLLLFSQNVLSQQKDTSMVENINWCVSICNGIVNDIESLKNHFPQLKEFSKLQNFSQNGCKISYQYKCHKPEHRGGWRGGVPNPDTEGVWFYLAIWDENDPVESVAQLNTQPVATQWYIKEKRVTFLMLEGEKTKSLYNEMIIILKRYGLTEK